MKDNGKIKIAGDLTIDDWNNLCTKLESDPSKKDWNDAYKLYFYRRLDTRYLEPIRVLRRAFNKSNTGEGFSIVTIQCCLIEFLESTVQGRNYRHSDTIDESLEYNNSEKIFRDFLSKREPFSNEFSRTLAGKFYAAVRCGLVHEASTKNSWTISSKTRGLNGQIVDKADKIIYRNNFQDALEKYIKDYGKKLPDDDDLQKGLIAKFKYLCK